MEFEKTPVREFFAWGPAAHLIFMSSHQAFGQTAVKVRAEQEVSDQRSWSELVRFLRCLDNLASDTQEDVIFL
jgi:hypothetical protein